MFDLIILNKILNTVLNLRLNVNNIFNAFKKYLKGCLTFVDNFN